MIRNNVSLVSYHRNLLLVFGVLTLVACGSSDSTSSKGGTSAIDGDGGVAGMVLIESQAEPAGDNCSQGGVALVVGMDTNDDGALDADEVASTSYVCNGGQATGADGGAANPGLRTSDLIGTTKLETGDSNCPHGGVSIVRGPDANGNGMLDASEVTDTQYVCNGDPTPAVIDGSAACVFPARWDVAELVCVRSGDWSGATLSGQSLSSTYLAGVDASGANFTGSDLSWTELRGADFTGANLTNADLSNASVDGTNFTNAVFDGANLTGVDLGDATLTGATGKNLAACPEDMPGGWRCLDLGTAGLTLLAPDANLNGLDLTGADLSGANLRSMQAINLIACPAQLPEGWSCVELPTTGKTLVGPGVDLAGVDLTGADLSGENLDGANLDNADLTSANLTNANLDRASFDNADLTNANLTGADLSDVDLETTTLDGVRSPNLQDCPTDLPNDWDCINDTLVGPGADLSGLNFTGEDFTSVELTGADLSRATLTDVDLDGVDMSGAILAGLRADDLQACPAALPTDWSCIQNTLVGPGVDLSGGNLAGANLSGIDLSGADLSGADLSAADLSNIDLSGTDLTNADLTDADLTSATMTDATLTGVTWDNTTCPNGVNSDSNGNTCVGTF